MGASIAATELCGQGVAVGGLVVRFRTDPTLLARLLPPGFEANDDALAQVEIAADASWARVIVSARYAERDGWFPVALWTTTDRLRFVVREGLGVGANHAEIVMSDGEARVSVGGEVVLRVAAGEGTGDAVAVDDRPLFGVRFSAHEDWTQTVASGAGDVLAIDWPFGTGVAADPANAIVEWIRVTPSEPATELPIAEVVAAWRSGPSGEITSRVSEPESLGTLTNDELNNWSPLRYPRPSVDRVIRRPEGWSERATGARWTESETTRWQSREETRFNPVEMIEINGLISPELHAQLLPAPCVAGARSLIKVMGLRFQHEGELPTNELWLMAYCGIGRIGAWYTVAHVVGPGGDLAYGREAFGYPTKSGNPSVIVSPVDCSLTGSRQGREFFYADGAFGGFSTGTTLGRLPTVSLRVRPGQRTGELVLQPWTYQGRRRQVMAPTAALGTPGGGSTADGILLDPWFGLGAIQLASMAAYETGLMQRAPGTVVATVAAPAPYYRERCDGLLPWESDRADAPQPSLVVDPDAASRS